jgi:menaquinone-9 beta-reductase
MLTAEARAHRMNPVQRLLFSGAARDPQLAGLVHRYAQRSVGPRRLLAPSALARAARVNVAA